MQEFKLEQDWLMQDIMPPFYLDLLGHILTKGHEVLHSKWYYQHVMVQPMLESTSELAYLVNIPALSTEPYLHFAWYYVRVTWNEPHIHRVKGPKELAMCTTGGCHFESDSDHYMGACS